MSMKLYVGNLAFQTSSEELQQLFAQAGTVESASIVEDRETGRSRGFGFVEMRARKGRGGHLAVQRQEGNGRSLTVNEARPREDRVIAAAAAASWASGGGGGGRGRLRRRRRRSWRRRRLRRRRLQPRRAWRRRQPRAALVTSFRDHQRTFNQSAPGDRTFTPGALSDFQHERRAAGRDREARKELNEFF